MSNGTIDDGNQQSSGFRFANATERTGALRLTQNFRVLIEGSNNDRDLRNTVHDFTRCVKAVAPGRKRLLTNS